MKGDYAYLPGTGPDGKRCRDCALIYQPGKKNGRCRKAAELRHLPATKVQPISLMTAACKYFEART